MKRVLQDYLSRHAELRNEIQAKVGALPGVNPECEDNQQENEELHASEVPLQAVIKHEFGLDFGGSSAQRGDGLASAEDIENHGGFLVGASTGDNIDAYRDDGTTWDEYMQDPQHSML